MDNENEQIQLPEGLTIKQAQAVSRKEMYDYVRDTFNGGKELTEKQHDAIKATMIRHAFAISAGLREQLFAMIAAQQARKERSRQRFAKKAPKKPTETTEQAPVSAPEPEPPKKTVTPPKSFLRDV